MKRLTTARRYLATATVLAVASLSLAACSGSSDKADTPIAKTAPTKLKGTISFYHFFADREAKVIQSVVDDFVAANPGVKVQVHSGQDDEKVQKAISSGNGVDVALSYSTDIVGKFCSTGAFQNLTPYIKRDKVDLSQLTDTVKSYTEYKGVRCTMPALADVYGLYYNKDMFTKAGITTPPKTLTELQADADKMTTFNSDGSIKTLGFNPMMGFYENSAAHYGPLADASWLDSNQKSAISASPGWTELMTWQKKYVDKIGYAKLQRFTAGLGQEFTGGNAFQKGKVAMNMDGEYRTAFIDDQAPKLNYGTAPFPTADDHTDLYGSGYITGNIAGIAKNSKNPELAWAFLKYLTTDTAAVVKLANGLKNVPTTTDALKSPNLEATPQFKTFLDIAANPHTSTTPASPVGAGYQQSFENYWLKYQDGKGGDLTAGLKKIDKQINDAVQLATGP